MARRRRNARDDLTRLLARANKGEASALPALRERFDAQPSLAEAVGEVAVRAEDALIKMAVGDSLGYQEAARRKLAALREEIAGPDATPLEQLLAERIAVCWLQVQHTDRWNAAADQVGGSLALGDYVQRRQDRAHLRYLSAIKTLAQVRRLLGPSVQVNIAEKQLNLAQLG